MKTENAVLMRQARESLSGKWKFVIAVSALYTAITFAVSSIRGSGPLLSLIISGPMGVGFSIFTLAVSRGKQTEVYQIFEGFKKNYFERSLVAYLLVALYTILWALLLIIPGIIKAIGYSQTFFILADDDTISAKGAMEKSVKMMYGYKWKYFCLILRFTGWFVLSILTIGVGFLWLVPYIKISMTKFYEDVSK